MERDLLSLENELVHNIRKQTLNGREFVVADVIMLREGVLNGSKGPLFYPAEEIAKRPGIWNGFPLTANHPTDSSGNPISARSPQAWQKFTIGHVFNDRWDESNTTRNAEVWFDIELTNKVNPNIIPAVLSGTKINVSTGLFTTDEKINNTQNHKGKDYQHIARNYQPDHLAVLLNDLGACSVRDGCGINLNSSPEGVMKCPECKVALKDGKCPDCGWKDPEYKMNRAQTVNWLTTNCGCYKGKEAVLNDEKAFTEAELKGLKENAEASTLAVNALSKIGVSLDIPKDTKLSDLPNVVANSIEDMKKMKAKKMKDMEDDEEEEEEPTKKKKEKPAMNQEQVNNSIKEYLGKLSEKERIDLIASPTLNSLIKTGEDMVNEKRVEIMKALTANISNDVERKAKLLKLKDKTLPQLKEILEFAGTMNSEGSSKSEEEKFLANFFGAQGSNNGQGTATYNRNDVLLPTAVYNSSDEEVTVETE